ncbi:AMP-binding protein [Acidiplasma cupricumulans]|uniref:AMP-binding protein n=1 Tax=Acidiplasma cupricumulans TaxID=312540 RepID=UPI00078291A8|nr:AMP-binding protein [Acidiplasma cupricumulans]
MDDEALIAYTSGTTGIPKGCVHTNKSVIANAIGASVWRRLTSSANELGAAPFFHVTGLAFSMLSPIYSGATITILTRWNSEAAIQAIEKYRVTHLFQWRQ